MSNFILHDLGEIELLPVTGLSIFHPALSGEGEWITSFLYPGEGSLFEARAERETDSSGRPRVIYYDVRGKAIILQTEDLSAIAERVDALKNKPVVVYMHFGVSEPFGAAADIEAHASWEAYQLNSTGGRSVRIDAMVYAEVETAAFGLQTIVNFEGSCENLYEPI